MAVTSKKEEEMNSKLIVVDTDCGIDDALAILLALYSDWKIVAFTTCRGNTSAPNAADNVMRLTNYCHRTDIPVYVGCSKPLVDIDTDEHLCSFHGDDGFGGVSDQVPTGDQSVQSEHAVNALVRYVSEQPGKIILVALGPLTNLAVAERLDPTFGSNLKELLIMGGNVDGIGNTTAAAEFNFKVDPEAAYTVLKEYTCPIKIFPWETCLRYDLNWAWFDKWVSQPTPIGRLVEMLTRKVALESRSELYPGGFYVPDLQATAILLYPELIKEELTFPVYVELGGTHTRGMLIVDRRSAHKINYLQEKGNSNVVTKLDGDLLKDVLMRLTAEDWTTKK